MKFRVAESINLDNVPEENKHGDCYVVASKYVMSHPNTLLVHGIVTGQGNISGLQYCHAWVEDGDTVIDKTVDIEIPSIIYYKIGRIEKVHKYNYKEMLDNMVKYETYGPWDEELLMYP